MVDLSQIGQTGNGQSASLSVSYKKGATVTGSLSLAYFVYDSVTALWSIVQFGTPVTLPATEATTCQQLTGTIPTGALQPGKTYGVGIWFARTGTGSGNIFVDDITINQQVVTTIPGCTTISSPVNGSTVNGGNVVFSWASVPTAVNYKVRVGTTPGGSDVFNGVSATTSQNVAAPVNKTLYAKVTPWNTNGDATGCDEISFTTNNQVGYCVVTSTQPSSTYPISSVKFNGLTNTSSSTVGAPGYEDFSNFIFTGDVGLTYPITIVGTGLGTNRFGATVFVDWNSNGSFNDPGEQYFTTAPFIGNSGATITLIGNMKIPDGVAPGPKRMRVKYNFNSSTAALTAPLLDPCENVTNGQVEDYTINVTMPTAPPDCTSITAPIDGATNVAANPGVIKWTAAPNAAGYKVYIGTTSGGTDIVNGDSVSVTTFSKPLSLNTKYYVKVVPFNAAGASINCPEISFTTAATFTYCTSAATNTNYEKISKVTFADIDNPSTSTAGYEDFTNIIGTVRKETSYPISVTINGFDGDQTIVWIDYNQNGVFDDNEGTVLTNAATSTGNITIPPTALEGKTRMRVAMRYSLAPTACGTWTYGQVEDYTIDIKPKTLGVNQVSKTNMMAYPNPFHDVLKLTDIKGVKSISVNDMTGRKLKTLAPSSDLNLSDLGAGVYVLSLQMEDGSLKSIKVIKN